MRITMHVHQVCGEYLSKREGPNYKIVEGDAFEEMEKLLVLSTMQYKEMYHNWISISEQ